jgi:hypothetical protein
MIMANTKWANNYVLVVFVVVVFIRSCFMKFKKVAQPTYVHILNSKLLRNIEEKKTTKNIRLWKIIRAIEVNTKIRQP